MAGFWRHFLDQSRIESAAFRLSCAQPEKEQQRRNRACLNTSTLSAPALLISVTSAPAGRGDQVLCFAAHPHKSRPTEASGKYSLRVARCPPQKRNGAICGPPRAVLYRVYRRLRGIQCGEKGCRASNRRRRAQPSGPSALRAKGRPGWGLGLRLAGCFSVARREGSIGGGEGRAGETPRVSSHRLTSSHDRWSAYGASLK